MTCKSSCLHFGSFTKKKGILPNGEFSDFGTTWFYSSNCTFLLTNPHGLVASSRVNPGLKNLIPAYLRDKKLFCKTKTFKRRDSTPVCSKAGMVSFRDKTKSIQKFSKRRDSFAKLALSLLYCKMKNQNIGCITDKKG